jgi:5-formyltetrahydrofolate cyclo-ligase
MAAPHSLPKLDQLKRAAREWGLAARAGYDPAWGEQLALHVLHDAPPPAGAVVAGFWPLPGEIDTRPLLLALRSRGHRLVLPVTPARGLPLRFLEWREGEELTEGRFATRHPAGPELAPDFVLVPLLAFDRRGGRVGFGAGYYDRTVATLPRVQTLGCAFAAQEMDEVPVGPYDVALDTVATERGVVLCRGG